MYIIKQTKKNKNKKYMTSLWAKKINQFAVKLYRVMFCGAPAPVYRGQDCGDVLDGRG